jgi:hypothetical protein
MGGRSGDGMRTVDWRITQAMAEGVRSARPKLRDEESLAPGEEGCGPIWTGLTVRAPKSAPAHNGNCGGYFAMSIM